MAGILRRVDKGLILWTQSSPGTFCIDQKFSLQFKLKLTSPLRHFRWVCLQTSATGVHEVNSICVVCVILVIRCLHTSAGSYPIHRLQSNDLAQLYRGRILLSANVEGGEKSMPAYLVCCHTTGAAVRSALFHTDTDAWAGREFYAAGCLVNRFTYLLHYEKPLMVYSHEPEATLSLLLVFRVRKRRGIAVGRSWMNVIDGRWKKGCPGRGDTWNVVDTVLTRSRPKGEIRNLTINRHRAGVSSTRHSRKTGIFGIMSIIYASCLSSGYNQKASRASAHTVWSQRSMESHNGYRQQRHLSNLCTAKLIFKQLFLT